MAISQIQKQIEALESKVALLEALVRVAKTDGGRITEAGKNLIYVMLKANMKKSQIAKIIDVTPAALTPYGDD